jgi:CheY-like chemotaxis protein
MAALESIVRLKPTKPYVGSSHIPPALGFFAASNGVRRALVGGSNTVESRDLSGALAAAHLVVDTAATGREMLQMATRSPDYELAWIDVGINHPEVATLLQQLRRDPRTASLRIGIVGRSGFFEVAEHLAANDPMAMAFNRPRDEEACRWQFEQLMAIAPQEFVGFEVRQRQAALALELLAELAQSSSKLYDLRRVQDSVLVALYTPKLSDKAVAVLANLNSAESQRALVDVAGRFVLPLKLRQAAAKAFHENLRKYGILLTTAEIRAQYDHYNASAKMDAPTRHVLALILDCLEAPTKTNE